MTGAQGAGGTWFRYVYDADGKRVKRNAGTASETWMVYGLDGEPVAEYAAANGVHPTPASPTTEYAYRLGEMLIQADASDCKWLVSDHLGSPRIILGKSGSLADTKRRDFMPFGEDLGAGQFGRTTALGYEAAGTPSNPREKFATYERDDETGLDFAQARYYQNRLGRFTSVDPENAGAEADDPQTWNAYAYGLNNPLRYSDPDGLKVRVRDLNGNEQILSDQEAKDGLFNKKYQQSVGGEVKDGNIYSNGELVGTYERISFDDQSDQFNQLIFGNRFDPGLATRGPVMNQAIGVFTAGTAVIGGTLGVGAYALGGTGTDIVITGIRVNMVRFVRLERIFQRFGFNDIKAVGRFFGWGSRTIDKPLSSFSRQSLEAAGWSKDKLLEVARAYRVIARNSTNPSATGRAEQLENLAKLFD
jgi:RHS repeat-associated protein